MSIKYTRNIKRRDAIDRIIAIATLIQLKDYKAVGSSTHEDDYNLQNFVDNGLDFSTDNLQDWTDKMIEDKINEPFFRYSMFDNYLLGT